MVIHPTPHLGEEHASALLGEITRTQALLPQTATAQESENRTQRARTEITQTGRNERYPGAMYKRSLPPKNRVGPPRPIRPTDAAPGVSMLAQPR
jgi:hypothetical protein